MLVGESVTFGVLLSPNENVFDEAPTPFIGVAKVKVNDLPSYPLGISNTIFEVLIETTFKAIPTPSEVSDI
jgi:hypothetical protein